MWRVWMGCGRRVGVGVEVRGRGLVGVSGIGGAASGVQGGGVDAGAGCGCRSGAGGCREAQVTEEPWVQHMDAGSWVVRGVRPIGKEAAAGRERL